MCDNLVHIASTISELQHTKHLKPAFLDTFKYTISHTGSQLRVMLWQTVTYYATEKPQNYVTSVVSVAELRRTYYSISYFK